MCVDFSDSDPEVDEIWDGNDNNFEDEIDWPMIVPDVNTDEETISSVLSRWLVHFMLIMQTVSHLSDIVITFFFSFFRVFFLVLGRTSSGGNDIARHLPSSSYQATKIVKQIHFKRYVVCKVSQNL